MTPGPTPTSTVFPATLDEEGRIAHALACRSCGYDLQGRRTDENCPECGTTVGASTRGDLLRFGDPRWVRGLARGILLLLIGQPLQLVIVMAGTTLAVLVPMLKWSINPQTVTALTGAGQSLCALAIVIGGWLLTAPDPTGMDRAVTRRLARAGLIFVVALGPGGTFLQNATMGAGAGVSSPRAAVLMAVFTVFSTLALMGWVALLLHVRTLVRRLPAPGFRKPLLVLAWAYALSTSLSSLTGFAVAFVAMRNVAAGATTGTMVPGPILFLIPLAMVFFLAYILSELAYITVLALLCPRFARAAHEAT